MFRVFPQDHWLLFGRYLVVIFATCVWALFGRFVFVDFGPNALTIGVSMMTHINVPGINVPHCQNPKGRELSK